MRSHYKNRLAFPGILILFSLLWNNSNAQLNVVQGSAMGLTPEQLVTNYLVGQGISSSRLTYAGYGLSKPVDTNDTEQGRATNRRTEFKVIDN